MSIQVKTNKATGLDKLSARLLKDSSSASSVGSLIDSSFRSGHFPKIWKSAKVIALFKKGDRTDQNNGPLTTMGHVTYPLLNLILVNTKNEKSRKK